MPSSELMAKSTSVRRLRPATYVHIARVIANGASGTDRRRGSTLARHQLVPRREHESAGAAPGYGIGARQLLAGSNGGGTRPTEPRRAELRSRVVRCRRSP